MLKFTIITIATIKVFQFFGRKKSICVIHLLSRFFARVSISWSSMKLGISNCFVHLVTFIRSKGFVRISISYLLFEIIETFVFFQFDICLFGCVYS